MKVKTKEEPLHVDVIADPFGGHVENKAVIKRRNGLALLSGHH